MTTLLVDGVHFDDPPADLHGYGQSVVAPEPSVLENTYPRRGHPAILESLPRDKSV